MQTIRQDIQVGFRYDVHFTQGVFDPDNDLLARIVGEGSHPDACKVLVVLDEHLLHHQPDLANRISAYFTLCPAIRQPHPLMLVPGGEAAKNDPRLVDRLHDAIRTSGLCRHSYVIAVGGGSVIDLVGYAAATAHRGIRLIRIPTTVLSQNDSAVGVKNSVNALRTKNFLGVFAPPWAVINDPTFLTSLHDRDWRAGIAEAIKVALVKDAAFFEELEDSVERFSPPVRDLEAMTRLIHRCAELHLHHIASSGDPFEMGTSRPLDFGHWSAHQLEQFSGYRLRHGEAVAIGIALDTTYSHLRGLIDERAWRRILCLFEAAGFELYAPELSEHINQPEHPRCIFRGLEAFREHLGGELTIMLLEGIGQGIEVHEVDPAIYQHAVGLLRERRRTAKHIA